MTPQNIMKTAARFYGLRPAELTGPGMCRRIAWPRFAAMAISRMNCRASLPRIGGVYHRHHATVLNGIFRANTLCRTNAGFALLQTRLQQILEAEMLIYISGPRTGEDAAETFGAAARAIARHPGAVALNPLELGMAAAWVRDPAASEQSRDQDRMRICLSNLIGAQAVVMLRGWQESAQARLEHDVAMRCGLRMYSGVRALAGTFPGNGAAQ